jgi:hypothetical protein
MGLFDDDTASGTEKIQGDPSAIEASLDALFDQVAGTVSDPGAALRERLDAEAKEFGEQLESAQAKASKFVADAERDFRADPVSFVTGTKVDVDLDPDDGTLSVRYQSALADVDGTWDHAKGAYLDAKVGTDQGPLPESFELHYADDNQGNVAVHGDATITLPYEEPITFESKGGLARNAEGHVDVQGRGTLGTEYEGVDLKGGTQAGYTDNESGTTVHAGPVVGAGKGAVDMGDDHGDLVEGELESVLDVTVTTTPGGQTSGGVTLTNTGQVDVAGETILELDEKAGVDVTTGPGGTRLGVEHGGEVTLGTDESGKVSGSTTSRRELGVDADGNRVDTTTTTNSGTIVTPDGETRSTSDTTTTEGDLWETFDAAEQLAEDAGELFDELVEDTGGSIEEVSSLFEEVDMTTAPRLEPESMYVDDDETTYDDATYDDTVYEVVEALAEPVDDAY